MWIYVGQNVHIHNMCVQVPTSQKRVSDLPELEFQAVLGHPLWVLETKLTKLRATAREQAFLIAKPSLQDP